MSFEYKSPHGVKVTLVDNVSITSASYHTISDIPLVLKMDDSGYIRNIGVIGSGGNLIPIFGGRFYSGFAPEYTPNWTPARDAFNAAKQAKKDADSVLTEISQLEKKLEVLRQKAERFGFERE